MTWPYTSVGNAALLTGDIVPFVDGTGKERVIRFEDIVALTSMVRQIGYWARPSDEDPSSRFVASFGTGYDSRSVDRIVLNDVITEMDRSFGLRDFLYFDAGAVNLDWAPPSLPIFDASSASSALEKFFADDSMKVPMVSKKSDLTEVITTDDLRKAYYDAKKFRRFFMNQYQFEKGDKWEDIKEKSGNFGRYNLLGPFMADDGDCTEYSMGYETTLPGYHIPRLGRTYDSKGTLEYTNRVTGSYILGIAYFYATRTIISSDKFLGDTLTAYLHFVGNYVLRQDDGSYLVKSFDFMSLANIKFYRFIRRGHDLFGKMQALYTFDPLLMQHMSLVERWLTDNIAEWESRKASYEFQLNKVIVDTGEVQNYFTDLSSWTWEPNAN